MLFNSFVFLVFAGAFFLAWPWARGKSNRRWAYLTCASFFFYGWWDWRFLFLLLISGFIDYFAALGMMRFPRRKKLLLTVSLLGNLGFLGVFKYLDFLTKNLNALLSSFGVESQLPPAGLILPIGISFYTFQSMSYTIDVYRGRLRPTRSVLHFFAYLSMFPQLVAGPILRASVLLPQLENCNRPTEEQRWDGLKTIVSGYFKKVVIADNLAPVINKAFNSEAVAGSSPFWWVIVTMFAFQIYCDFSGYSDIARGLAKWMGYEFPRNFNHPYRAASLRDFWGRWHISLSSWFRDYVYVPLGGSRRGRGRQHLNTWITMLLSGLWHGAAWTFVVWGALHSAMMTLERTFGLPERIGKWKAGRLFAVLLVLIQVWIGWVFFRANSIGQATDILSTMFNPFAWNFLPLEEISRTSLAVLGLAIAYEALSVFRAKGGGLFASRSYRALELVFIVLAIAACVFFRGPGSAFIYFQF